MMIIQSYDKTKVIVSGNPLCQHANFDNFKVTQMSHHCMQQCRNFNISRELDSLVQRILLLLIQGCVKYTNMEDDYRANHK